MKLKLLKIIERGVLKDERVHLLAEVDLNLTFYLIFSTYRIGDGVSRMPERVYWFPEHEVKAGDHVILYTRAGTDSTNRRNDGATNHFFFQDLDSALYTKSSACVLALEVNTWMTSA